LFVVTHEYWSSQKFQPRLIDRHRAPLLRCISIRASQKLSRASPSVADHSHYLSPSSSWGKLQNDGYAQGAAAAGPMRLWFESWNDLTSCAARSQCWSNPLLYTEVAVSCSIQKYAATTGAPYSWKLDPL